ncbi:hypothetical protein GGR56DRAFT_231045 [Xylariaceae sp. FL0804]|nr:hypothetical protein GGR56DRAFT_231045 [Xylariaceae sp. FL0804]
MALRSLIRSCLLVKLLTTIIVRLCLSTDYADLPPVSSLNRVTSTRLVWRPGGGHYRRSSSHLAASECPPAKAPTSSFQFQCPVTADPNPRHTLDRH